MSIKATNWAWSLSLPPALKLILMALADEADDDGLCWPSVRRIARKAGVSERTVQRAIKKYGSSDLLRVSVRSRTDGSQASNFYHLALEFSPGRDGDEMSPPKNMADDKMSPRGGAQMSPQPVDQVSPLGAARVSPLYPLPDPLRTTTTQNCASGAEPGEPPSLVPPSHLSSADGIKAVGIVVSTVSDPIIAQQVLDELDAKIQGKGIRGSWENYLKGLVRKVEANEFIPAAGRKIAKRREEALSKENAPKRASKPSTREVADARFAEIRAALGKKVAANG